MSITIASPVLRIFSANQYSWQKNLEGISHAESIAQLHPECNTINWLAGHIVFVRDQILIQLNESPLCTDTSFASIYNRGTKHFDPADAAPIEQLFALFEAGQTKIIAALERPDEQLPSLEVLTKVNFYAFHEAYHIGQLGILRKMLGKNGALA